MTHSARIKLLIITTRSRVKRGIADQLDSLHHVCTLYSPATCRSLILLVISVPRERIKRECILTADCSSRKRSVLSNENANYLQHHVKSKLCGTTVLRDIVQSATCNGGWWKYFPLRATYVRQAGKRLSTRLKIIGNKSDNQLILSFSFRSLSHQFRSHQSAI